MEKKPVKFSKVLNTWDVLVTAFGAMIGWGWVVSSGEWIQTAGVAGTMIGFVIGGFMIYFVGLAYAELTSVMPQCGTYAFSRRAFGPTGAFICTWAGILSYIGVVCFEACSLPTIMQYLIPGFLQGYLYTIAGFDVYATWLAVAVAFAVLITLVNIRGVKTAAKFQTVLTVAIGAIGLILVVSSVFSGSTDNLSEQLFVGEGGNTVRGVIAVAAVAPFFLFGFDVIPQTAAEINVPLKKLGKLLILSIVLAVGFYAAVVFAVGLLLNSGEISQSMNASGLVTADAMAKAFSSQAMAKVLIIGGICGVITSWNSFLMGGSRTMYSMARSYMLPHFFAELHPKFKTPHNALKMIGLLSAAAPFFGRAMLGWIANTASFACCVTYCMVSLAFMVIRVREPDMEKPFRVRHFRLVGVLAVLLSGVMALLYVIPGSGSTFCLEEAAIALGWALLGVIFALSCRKKYGKKFGRSIE